MSAAPCDIEDCAKRVHAGGLCPMHYQRRRRFGDAMIESSGQRKARKRVVGVEPCAVDGCEKVQVARGWCTAHWTRWNRHGSPAARLRGEVIDGKRICPGCGEDKPLADYSPSSADRCKACVAARARAYRLANPDRPKWKRDPAKARAQSVAWRAANPEKVRAQTAARRARKVGATVETFLPAEIFDRDAWVCSLCRKAIDQTLRYPDPLSVSLDHIIPLSRGGAHSRANAQASHLTCNLHKHVSVEGVSA